MIPNNAYWYNFQIRKYLLQFMCIFEGLQVEIGKSGTNDAQLIPVPIKYGHPDRVVAALIADNVQTKPLRLPLMTANIQAMRLNMSRAHGIGTERRISYVPVGGLVPDDIQVVHQRMPVPYDVDMNLNIYASNTDQQMQILEQILPMFDPFIQIQTSDKLFDWTKINKVELKDVGIDNNMPIGADKRINQNTLTFEMQIWLDTPAEVKNDFVGKVFSRIQTMDVFSKESYELLAELDELNVQYETVISDEELPFQ